MACPTCDHTMKGLGAEWFWCPRCGTLRANTLNGPCDETPSAHVQLVKVVQRFIASATFERGTTKACQWCAMPNSDHASDCPVPNGVGVLRDINAATPAASTH